MVRGSEARPVPRRKDELLLGKVCPNALCKLECIHSLEFQLNSNQSRMCQTLGCDGQLLKRKPRGKLPPPGPGILTRAPSSRAPHQDGTCNAGRILHLPTSFPASPSPPYRVFLGPSPCLCLSLPAAPPGFRIEQEAASSTGQSFLSSLTPAWITNALPSPSS